MLSFLEVDDDIEDFIEDPLWTLPPETPTDLEVAEDPPLGRRIGPYRLERLLGRGGMGAVFLAVREDDYQQHVALKVVSWESQSDDILSRFYNERQILARLEHPDIARLLDGGTTDDGRPYLVMEYVEGEPIDHYCETRRLTLRECLQLFREVCAAVHFAHQNLVVHRDLKPSNILVTTEGRPRLLDFGIAKLLKPELTARPVTTTPGQIPMTPAYASPEQALGEPITTATDVYALGVLLYRLLAGRLPFRFQGKKYAEMIRSICHEEPIKPSLAVLETTGAGSDAATTWRRPTRPSEGDAAAPKAPTASRRLFRRLAGDLDAIVLKAMRKEPQHRYASAIELSNDVRRYLTGRAVQARRGTGIYRFSRFLRRNKLALAVMLLITASAVTTTVLWRQAVRQRTQAEQQRERAQRQQMRAERVSVFLEDLFASADPERASDDLRVREILDVGRQKIALELADEPELQADLLGTLGTVYQNLGIFDQARDLKEAGLQRRRLADATDRPELATDLNNLASLLYAVGDYSAAETRFREVLEIRTRLGEDDLEIARTQHNLASTLMQLGRYSEAEVFFQAVLDLRRERDDALGIATSLYSLGALHSNRGDFARAEPLLRQALEIRTTEYGSEHPRVAAVLGSLGWLLNARGAHAEALEVYQRVLSIRLERLGEGHSAVATARKNLASVQLALGQTESAGALLEQVLAVLRQSPRRDRWELADAESLYGVFLADAGRYSEAETYLIASYRTIRDLRGTDNIDTREALIRVADLYSAWGRPDQAATYRALLTARRPTQ